MNIFIKGFQAFLIFSISALFLSSIFAENKDAFAEEILTFTEFPITDNAYVNSITAGPDGNVWFSENVTQYGTPTVISQKIGKVTPSGTVIEYPVQNVTNLTNGPDGNVWFTANGISSIGKITPSGVITTYSRPSDYDYVRFITNGPDGNIWFTINGGYIGRITPGGIYLARYTLPSEQHPSGITTGADGNIWFTEPSLNKIGKITPSGSLVEFSISGAVWGDIVQGADGNVWFIERIQNNVTGDIYKIGKISPSGIVTEFSGGNPSGDGIAKGSDGNIWYTAGLKIGRITTGGIITEFDSPGIFSTSRMTGGPDGNIWFAYSTNNDITDSKIVRANLMSNPNPIVTPTSTPIKFPTSTPTKTPTPTIKPSITSTPKPRNIPQNKITPSPTPRTTSTSVNGKLYWCTDNSDFCTKSFSDFSDGNPVKMVCWMDDRTTAEGAYSTNRWFYVNFPDGREGFASAATIVSQTVTPHCSTLKNIQSSLWAINQRDSTLWYGLCLSFVRKAYTEAGYDLGPPQTGDTKPTQWWNAHKNSGITDKNAIPPRGALVFWDGYKTDTKDFSAGHVVISLGNGYAMSTYERNFTNVHIMNIAERNNAPTAKRGQKFIDLYQGYFLP